MEIRILNGAQVRALLTMADCIALMRRTMAAVSEGRALVPLRTILPMPGGGLLGAMPGYVDDPACFGVKALSIFPHRGPSAMGSHPGFVLLFGGEDGAPLALMEAGAVTAVRTAAASGLAADLLARPDAGDLAILGAGEQAATHLEAMLAVRPLRRVRVWARDPARAAAFAETQGARHGVALETSPTPQAAVAGADLICTVTKAREPILLGDWVSDGCHLNLVGASQADATEVDTPLVARARYFVDMRQSALAEAGEYRRALEAGAITPDHILGEIGAVAAGTAAGRTSDREVTIYKSLGIAAQDMAAAHHVFEKARREGLGTVVRM